ncbi:MULTISPECIES: acyl-CoA dehydrogenase [Microbacterium]|uniref:acyl-CoA dehydrogenase n=1 Tax=Microbacterium TaxID=33882 RepID=UPI00278852FD|nr:MULTISPECIES: acyl-CoA dehydrogenase [Microbacterium]MDQ1085266.1 alkylation response protein AidB-like acyl-CoA dehydrogenase [Microbacterium sp. SORGH_AS_0344]MDQ1169426.1 alkylation response protein AidB-like acyl-CoA dehydrogenase [Microbacterium proteolyticum]
MTDGHHPPFPLLFPADTPGLGDVRDALARADDVDGFGTDIAATLSWAGSIARPSSLAATWELLAAVAARDVTAARVLEPHLDALAILDEAAASEIPLDLDTHGCWGVFAAEGPGVRLEARQADGTWTLHGTKPWCSLAADLDRALITAWIDDERRQLFAIDLRDPAVTPRSGPWHARGLDRVVSAPIDVDGARAVAVGDAGWYLRRPGFAHGGVGVAACWWGAALPLRVALADAARGTRADQLSRVHLGRADTALWAARTVLVETAAVFRAGGTASEGLRAARARTVIADAVETTIAEAAHALGPLPLVADEAHARRVADLQVYVRQHHAERDLARIGGDIANGGGAW